MKKKGKGKERKMSRAHPTGTKQHQNESHLSNRREDPKHQENKVI